MIKIIKTTCVLVLFLLLVSCNNSDKDITTEMPENLINIEESVNELTLAMNNFYGTDSSKNNSEKESFKEMFKKLYNINLEVFEYNLRTITKNDLLENSDLISIGRFSIGNYVEDGSIVPITEYLKNNKVWETLPDYFTNMVVYNNEIYGIPITDLNVPVYSVRFINQQWLDNLAIDLPTTTSEFYEVAKMFVRSDPDKNGIDDTVGFIAEGLYGLEDIFISYDCYFNALEIYNPAWNPNTGFFEDALSKDSMIDCLNFLKLCYDEKLLHKNSFEYNDRLNGSSLTKYYYKNNIGSTFNKVIRYNEIIENTGANHSVIAGLSNIRNENLIRGYLSYDKAFTLSKYADNKEDVINTFVNIFLGDTQGFFMGRYGILGDKLGEGDFFIENDNTIYLNCLYKNGAVKRNDSPNIINFSPNKTNYEIIYYSFGESYNEAINVLSTADISVAEKYVLENQSKFYLYPQIYNNINRGFWIQDDNYMTKVSELGKTTIKNAITGELSVSDAIEYYKQETKIIGTYSLIEEVNSLIATKSFY